MSISIAMGTYNGERFIAEQLESFARQTLLPAELVVTDDGSTDATLDIIAAFATRAPFPVRVERNAENLGFRANFMKAAALCKSDFIALSDQDDVWLPHKLETCLAAFNSEDVLLAYHNATVVTAELVPTGNLDQMAAPQATNLPLSIEPTLYGPGFTFMFRSLLLGFNDYWPDSTDFLDAGKPEAHDQWFFFLPSCLGIIKYINEPLALYRRHGGNATGLKNTFGIRKKWDNLRATNLAGIRARELSAGKRAAILERISQTAADPQKTRALAAAARYRTFESHYRLRQKMYLSGSFLSRLSQLLGLLQTGGYHPRAQWGVGRKALVRDVVCGLLFPIQN